MVNLTKYGEFCLDTISEFDENFTICSYHWEMKILKISAFLIKGVLGYGLFRSWTILAWGWFLNFGQFSRGYNYVGSKVMNLKFSGSTTSLKACRNRYLEKLLLYWMSKIDKKIPHFFLIFIMFLSSNTREIVNILNICSLHKNITIYNGTNKTKYLNHLLKNNCTVTHRSLPWYFKNWKICHFWMAKNLGEQ